MNNRFWTTLAATIIGIAPLHATRAFGWGRDGHVVVAAIAEAHLSQPAKAAIDELLGEDSISDMRVAVWADEIKRSANFQRIYPNNGQWHFIDIPIDAEASNASQACRNGDCVTQAVQRFSKTVVDPKADQRDRKQALMFLVHLIGDAHQPLHCAERNGDKGGNKLSVTYLGDDGHHNHGLNLHAVWDDNLVQEVLDGLNTDDAARRLDSEIGTQQMTAWQQGSIVDWAWECHLKAVNCAYKDGQGEELPSRGLVELDQAYVDANVPVVREQLKKGGIRLATVLNGVFRDRPGQP